MKEIFMRILMTLKEAKERLNISASTLRRLIAKKTISYYRVGLKIMFSDDHITNYLRSVEASTDRPQGRTGGNDETV
jgi:excisionase family DNA binding protein